MSYRNGGGGGDFGSSSDRVGSRGHSTMGGNGSNNGGLKHRLDRTPISMPRVCSKSVFSCGGGGGMDGDNDDDGHSRHHHEKSSSSFLPDCGFGTRIKSEGPPPTESMYEDETDEHGYVVERKIRNGASHGGGDGQNMGSEGRGEKKGRGGSTGGTITSAKTSVTKRLVKEIEKQFKRLADPDMQLAGLI